MSKPFQFMNTAINKISTAILTVNMTGLFMRIKVEIIGTHLPPLQKESWVCTAEIWI